MELHTPASIALELGRFEMHLRTQTRTMHYDKSEMTLEQFCELRFNEAAEIYVTEGSYLPGLKPSTLEQLGTKRHGAWRIEPLTRGNTATWRKLLNSDMPIILVPPTDPGWVDGVILSLHSPIVYVNENMGLSSKAHSVCRRLLKAHDSLVLIAFGLYRETFSFFGKGPAFDHACATMAQRPQALLDHTNEQRRALVRSAFKLVRNSR